MRDIANLILLKYAAGAKFALLGHTLGLWMRSLEFSLSAITIVGTVFATPFALKPFWYSLVNKYFQIDYKFTKVSSIIEYTLLVLVTLLPAGKSMFFISISMASLFAAVFDAILIGEMRRKTEISQIGSINRLSLIHI